MFQVERDSKGFRFEIFHWDVIDHGDLQLFICRVVMHPTKKLCYICDGYVKLVMNFNFQFVSILT